MQSGKTPVPRSLLFIAWLLLICSLITAVFGLSLLAFGIDSPHPIYKLIGYSYGDAPLWGLSCIAPIVIGICSVVMSLLYSRYAGSQRYQVMAMVVRGLAVLGALGGAGLLFVNMTNLFNSWTPLASQTLNGYVFHLALWADNDDFSSRYYVFRCDGADLFCDQIAIVAPCKCQRPSLTGEDNPQMDADQTAQTVSVTIKGTQAYLYQSK